MTPSQAREAFAYVQGMDAAPSTKRKTLLKIGIKSGYLLHQGAKQLMKAAKFAAKFAAKRQTVAS